MGHFHWGNPQKMPNLHPRPQFQPTKKPPVPVGLKVLTIRGPQQQYEGTRPHCGLVAGGNVGFVWSSFQ